MVDGSLGKQIPVGEISVELAMPGNLTKELGHAGTDAPEFAKVLLGSLQNAEGLGANALPPIHSPLKHAEDSLPDSLSASLAVALSDGGVVAKPIPQLPASDPQTESIAAIPAGVRQQLARADSAVGFPLPTSPADVEANPVLSMATPRPPASDPRVESLAASPAGVLKPLRHTETAVDSPIPTVPVGDEAHPASFMHSIRQPSPDATASTRINPVSLPPQPSAEIRPALAETRCVEPAMHTANASDTLPMKTEFAWSIQEKTNNNSPRMAVSLQIPGLNTPSKESAQVATQPRTELQEWITFTTERAQADAPTASSATTFLQPTQHRVTPPDPKVEGPPAPTLPLQSVMKILVRQEPDALPAHSAQTTATQSGPRDPAVSNRFSEPVPTTPAAEPMAAAPQINQRISEEASPKPNIGTGHLSQSSDSSDAALALVSSFAPGLPETPKVTLPSAETATVQMIGGRTAASDPVSETIPARTLPQQISDKESARSSNTHSQNPEKERAAGDASNAAPHLATAERGPAAQAGAHTSADSALDAARAGAAPTLTGKAVSGDSVARTNAPDQPAERPMPSPGLEVWNGGDNAQTRLVQSARLASHPDRTEMRVSLEAERLGTVELQAKVTNDQVRAAIAVNRHDTHAVLASDLSALHQALNDRQLGAAHVTLFQGSLSSNDTFGNGTLAGRREASPQANENTRWAGGESLPTIVRGAELPLANNIFDSNGRLSVRA